MPTDDIVTNKMNFFELKAVCNDGLLVVTGKVTCPTCGDELPFELTIFDTKESE